MAWELNGNADATATSFLGPTNTQPLIVKTAPTAGATPLERLRVTPEGRVGIGIINPSAKLTVAGGGAIINNVAIGTDGLSVDYPNEQETIGLANPGTSAVLRLQSPNGLAFHTGPPGTAAADNLRMTITSSGEVGIGKAPTANYKLEVAGTVNATDYHKNGSVLVSSQWTDVTDGISYAGGNVGIGTTEHQYGRLTIEEAGVPLSLRETGQAPTAGGLWRMPLDSGILRFDVNTAAAGDFSSYLTPLAMTAAGNVGIGTANPTTDLPGGRTLHVDSANGGSALRLGNGATNGQQWEWQSTVINSVGAMNLSKLTPPLANPLTILASGNVGVGTTAPLYKVHVVGPGGFGAEDSNGGSLAGNVPIVAQSNSTAVGVINANGRQAFALNIDSNGGATNTRGVPSFYDKYDGGWHHCFSLKNGRVGVNTYDPQASLDVNGDISIMGKHALRGNDTWLRLNQDGKFPAGVHTPGVFAPVSLNVGGVGGWGNPGGGNVWVAGSVGIGTTPGAKLHVAGGDIRLEAGRTFYSPGRLHVHGEELLYILNKAGVVISRAWGGRGNLIVDGEVRLGAGDAPVYIGGNQTGQFMRLHDDLWFGDPQNGTIEIGNHDHSKWGTMVGFFNGPSSIEYKKDTSVLGAPEMTRLLDDALRTDVVRYRYKGDDEASRLRLGVITENCPEYLIGEGGKSLSSVEYTAMLHGALKALADRVATLENSRSTQT